MNQPKFCSLCPCCNIIGPYYNCQLDEDDYDVACKLLDKKVHDNCTWNEVAALNSKHEGIDNVPEDCPMSVFADIDQENDIQKLEKIERGWQNFATKAHLKLYGMLQNIFEELKQIQLSQTFPYSKNMPIKNLKQARLSWFDIDNESMHMYYETYNGAEDLNIPLTCKTKEDIIGWFTELAAELDKKTCAEKKEGKLSLREQKEIETYLRLKEKYGNIKPEDLKAKQS